MRSLSTSSKKILNEFLSLFFILSGKKPWSLGYDSYKWKMIEKYLHDTVFSGDALIDHYGFRIDERIIEYPWFFSRLSNEKGVLLDAGSTLNYESILDQPSLRSKKIYVSTLAPEKKCYWYKGVSYIFEDLRSCSFKDNFFDWVACISTAEHIGLDNTFVYTEDRSFKENSPDSYLDAIKEFRRILKPEGVLYLTLPFGQKHIHRWFQVFDSQMIDQIITVFGPSSVIENHFRYQSEGWERSSRELSKNATCFDIRQQKEYDPDFAAFSRGIVCLEMRK